MIVSQKREKKSYCMESDKIHRKKKYTTFFYNKKKRMIIAVQNQLVTTLFTQFE
jgi:hypothetical protein